MKCRLCGFEFDETDLENRGCTNCGKYHNCNQVHCPRCGFGNHPEFEDEFDFIVKLKEKFRNRKKASN